MTEVEVVRAEPAHVDALAPRVREADREELWAAAHETPRRALLQSLRVSSEAWTGLLDGHVAAMWGLRPHSFLGGNAVVWMIGSDLFDRYPATVARAGHRILHRYALRKYPVLWNMVDARNRRTLRWLAWVGFSILPAVPFGAEGLPFHPVVARRR